MGKMDTTLFDRIIIKICLCKVYVDDITFGSTNQELCEEFSEMIQRYLFDLLLFIEKLAFVG